MEGDVLPLAVRVMSVTKSTIRFSSGVLWYFQRTPKYRSRSTPSRLARSDHASKKRTDSSVLAANTGWSAMDAP